MGARPCSICNHRFTGAAITGYHRWYLDGLSLGYKQQVCFACAQTWLGPIQEKAIDMNDPAAVWPETCADCGEATDDDASITYTTWFRGKTRKDTALVMCPHCAAGARQVLMQGAERLEDRGGSRGGGGGAPSPTPETAKTGGDLPW